MQYSLFLRGENNKSAAPRLSRPRRITPASARTSKIWRGRLSASRAAGMRLPLPRECAPCRDQAAHDLASRRQRLLSRYAAPWLLL